MNNRRLSLALDVLLLLGVITLQAKLLTGVPLHEWLALGFTAVLLVHLTLHWSWLETHARRLLAPASARAKINMSLNLALLADMTVATFSGFMLSDTVLPVTRIMNNPAHMRAFRRWHGIHELSSHSIFPIVALHLALNWDWVRTLWRRRGPRVARSPVPVNRASTPWLRSLLFVTVAVALISSLTWLISAVIPPSTTERQEAAMFVADSVRAAPGIAHPQFHPGPPNPSLRGLPVFIAVIVLIALIAMAGRRLLSLRLEEPIGDASGNPADVNPAR